MTQWASGTPFTAAGFRGAPPEVPAAAIAWLVTEPDATRLHAGTLVFAQKVAKDLGLVPGWPPPKPAPTGS